MPGSTPTLHVTAKVTCPTTGYTAHIEPHSPQGFNPAIYLLDLIVVPPAEGMVVHHTETDVDVHFKEDTTACYSHVTILPEDTTVEVKITQ